MSTCGHILESSIDMVAGPIQAFTRDNIKTRWAERYTSDSINKKFIGLPRGIYLGFVPSQVGLVLNLLPDKAFIVSSVVGSGFSVGDVLTTFSGSAIVRVVSAGYLLVDSVVGIFNPPETVSNGTGTSATLSAVIDEGVSLGRVVSSSTLSAGRSEHMLDVITTDTISLDFTGFIDGVYYVILTATYSVGTTTVGSIITRTTPLPTGAQEVLVCTVTKIGGALTVQATNPTSRQGPLAFSGNRIGFMPGGAIEDLLLAIAAVTDINNAKTDTLSVVHPSLTERLTADFSVTQLGQRLGKIITSLRSNDIIGVRGSTLNISHSFAGISRTQEPKIDMTGGGSELINGAITAPTDTDRNIVGIQDIATGRPYADPSTGNPVFGRLTYAEVTSAVILTFMDGSTGVTTPGDPTLTIENGDIIIDPEGNYYPVATVAGLPLSGVVLQQPWNRTNPTGPLTVAITRRRFTLNLFTRSGGAETAYSVVREVSLNPGAWVGVGFGLSAPGTPEIYSTDGGATGAGVIVRQTFNGASSMLYVPTLPTDELTFTQTINEVAFAPTKTAITTGGTPTSAAPDLRFMVPTFQPVNESRSDQKSTWLQAPTIIIPRASENFDGLTRYATNTGVERFTALQASDTRVLTQNEKDAASNATAPTSANPFVTQDTLGIIDAVSKGAAWQRWGKSGTILLSTPSRIVFTFALEDGDNHSSQVQGLIPGGIITLTRPPTGVRYSYTITFTGGANSISLASEFVISPTASTAYISGRGGNGSGAGFQGGNTVTATVEVDSVAAGGVLNNLFEVQQLPSGTIVPNNSPESRVFISRVARAE